MTGFVKVHPVLNSESLPSYREYNRKQGTECIISTVFLCFLDGELQFFCFEFNLKIWNQYLGKFFVNLYLIFFSLGERWGSLVHSFFEDVFFQFSHYLVNPASGLANSIDLVLEQEEPNTVDNGKFLLA